MKQLRFRLAIVCVSYTTNILVILILNMSWLGMSNGFDDRSLLQLFITHNAVSLGIYIVDLLVTKGKFANYIASVVVALLVVLFFGGFVFNLFPLNMIMVLLIAVVVVVVYAVTVWATFLMNQNDAERINKKLKEKNDD